MLSLVSRKGLASLGALAAVAVLGTTSASAAHTKSTAGSKIFNVTNLVSDGTFTAVATDAALVNGWGLSASADLAVVVSNNGTNTSTLYNGAGTKTPLTVAVPGGPTGTVAERTPTDFADQPERRQRRLAVPVRDRGRHDPRLGADRQRRRRRSSASTTRPQGRSTRASRPLTTGSTRPTSTTRVSTSSTRRSSRSPLATRSRTRRSPRAGRRSGSRRSNGNIFVTYAQQDKAQEDESRAAASATSTSSRPTARSSRRSPRRARRTPR